jgi:hypothetical protein
MRLTTVLGIAAALFSLLSAAYGNQVTIALQEDGVNGGAITTVATGDQFASVGNLAYGTFSSVSVTGLGYGQTADGYSALFSDLIAASSASPGTLTVYVSLDAAKFAPPCFHGCFGPPITIGTTVNALPTANPGVSLGWSVDEDAYYCAQDFATSCFMWPLGASHTFNTVGSFQDVTTGCGSPTTGPRCVDGTLFEKYVITATGLGVTADTIIVSTPGPVAGAGLPGLIAVCGGLLGWWRRRRPRLGGLTDCNQ